MLSDAERRQLKSRFEGVAAATPCPALSIPREHITVIDCEDRPDHSAAVTPGSPRSLHRRILSHPENRRHYPHISIRSLRRGHHRPPVPLIDAGTTRRTQRDNPWCSNFMRRVRLTLWRLPVDMRRRPATAAEPIKIGFSIALTGGLAANGKAALLAMQMWADDVNKKGGPARPPGQAHSL